MNFENEITVEVDCGFDDLKKILNKYDFKVEEEYEINDIYFISKDFKSNEPLEILKNVVMVREIIEKDKVTNYITYKYKKFNDRGEIVKQGKVNCQVYSIESAKELLKSLNYKELIKINDRITVLSNGIDEMSLQSVNDKHLYIEIEEKCHYINKNYENLEELKKVITRYNIPIVGNDYFVKKAQIEMIESGLI